MLLRSVTRRTVRAQRSAFTLLEILVVAAIVTMLAGAGIYYFVNQLDDAKVSRAKIDCKGLAEQVDIFNTKHGKYPGSIQELTQEVDGMKAQIPPEGILDPWGGTYQLDTAGERVVVSTKDPKGKAVSNLDVK
jgi:general secretion pathway protein G